MSPVSGFAAFATMGLAFSLGLALVRRLISPLRFAQIAGGLGSGLVIVLAAIRLLAGDSHG